MSEKLDVDSAGRMVLVSMLCCIALSFLSGCSNEPKLVSNQTAAANSNAQANSSAQGAGPRITAPSAPDKAQMGEVVDTSAYDARIRQGEELIKRNPDDAALRKRLAQLYLERGNALTQARQYQAALGDYRRTLRYDPDNEEARRWSDTIIGILKQMNREVPAEGAEPTPLKQ